MASPEGNESHEEPITTPEQVIREYLSYQDVVYKDLDPESSKKKKQEDLDATLADENAQKYAEALLQISKDRGFVPMLRLTRELRQDLAQKASALGITMMPHADSVSWGMWDIGKQSHFFTHKAEVEEKYRKRLGDPMTSKRKQDEIMRRHLGHEAYMAFRDKKWSADAVDPSVLAFLTDLSKEQKPDGQLSSDNLVRLGIVLDREARKKLSPSNQISDHTTEPGFVNIYGGVSDEHANDSILTASDTTIAPVTISEADLEGKLSADDDGNIRTTSPREIRAAAATSGSRVHAEPIAVATEPHASVEPAAHRPAATETHTATAEPIHTRTETATHRTDTAHATGTANPETAASHAETVHAPESTHTTHPEAAPAKKTIRQEPRIFTQGLRDLWKDTRLEVAKAGALTIGAGIAVYLGAIFYFAKGVSKLSIEVVKAMWTLATEGAKKAFKSLFGIKDAGHDAHGGAHGAHDAHGGHGHNKAHGGGHGHDKAHGHGGGHGGGHGHKPAKKGKKKKDDHGHGGHGHH